MLPLIKSMSLSVASGFWQGTPEIATRDHAKFFEKEAFGHPGSTVSMIVLAAAVMFPTFDP